MSRRSTPPPLPNQPPTEDKPEIARRRSCLELVPFAGRLLDGQSPGGPYTPLPVGDPKALAQQAVQPLAEMARRAVLKFVFRRCGWRRLRTPSLKGNAVFEGRLWDYPGVDESQFGLTAAGIDMLVAAFNAAGRTARQIPGEMLQAMTSLVPRSAGDLLLHHLVLDALVEQQMRGVYSTSDGRRSTPAVTPVSGVAAHLEPFGSNPLNQFSHSSWFELPADSSGSARMLFSPEFRPLLPWLIEEWTRDWTRRENAHWASREWFAQGYRRHAKWWQFWIATIDAENRPDLLVPLLGYAARLSQPPSLKKLRQRYEAMSSGLSFADRQPLTSALVGQLVIGRELACVRDRLLQIHPVDREIPDRLYLEASARLELDATVQRLDQLIMIVQPTLS